jgi:hypothetical protein
MLCDACGLTNCLSRNTQAVHLLSIAGSPETPPYIFRKEPLCNFANLEAAA